ncbi:MAG TPA: metalloregulator ArsR/SmtB family transcription factor [Spirochaetota bacterium]|nr:metalloregulator ArsR/SmtB family transcription factor [Spirochaetota bacterium]HPJ35820.1 metalloregulator ArsR/SmtB family transcription factor [Spirochaetota bacterium]
MGKINYEKESELLKAIAHPVRLKIVNILMGDECCVTELIDMLNLPQSTISQHLGVLKRAGVLHPYKSGVKTCYKVTSDKVAGIISVLG